LSTAEKEDLLEHVMLNRRDVLRAIAYGGATTLAGCGAHRHAAPAPSSEVGFARIDRFGRVVYRIGPPDGAPVLLLHELPGLTPDDLQLARRLADERFNVYVPLLFGNFGQDSILAGYWQACRDDVFECSKRSARSPILDWLERVSDGVAAETGRPIGVIGMCLTGILPLALLRPGVDAAVVCQPTIPFSSLLGRPVGAQRPDLGLAAADLQRATASSVPFLALRYATDSLCPTPRVEALRTAFPARISTIELEGEGHSTLASSFNQQAFADAVGYLRVRLKAAAGPYRMARAMFQGRPCEITAAGVWRAL
jgi:dienelactone hydrolase